MPQMSPMYWTMILIMITAIMIQISSMNYFEHMSMKSKKFKKKMKKINWKW